MRVLHRVRRHESFIASGVYHCLEDDKPSGVVEHWSIHQLPDQSQIIRVDRDGRADVLNHSLLLEALRSADGYIERCDIRMYYAHEKMMREARATYNFIDEHVEIGRNIEAKERIDEIVALPPQTVIYPPVRIFAGSVIARLAARIEGKAPVFLPNTDVHSSQLLSGSVEERSAHFLGAETIDISGKHYAARHYQFGSSSQAASLWLDEHEVLIRSVYQNLNNRVETTILTQYARKP